MKNSSEKQEHKMIFQDISALVREIFVLCHEFEWSLKGEISLKPEAFLEVKQQEKVLWWLHRVEKYFTRDEMESYKNELLLLLESALSRIEVHSDELSFLPTEFQEEVARFIKKELFKHKSFSGKDLSEKFKDMLFAAFGIDHIDLIGNAQMESVMCIEKTLLLSKKTSE